MTNIRSQIAEFLGNQLPGNPEYHWDWHNVEKSMFEDVADVILSMPGVAIVDSTDFQQLLSVADLYVNAFSEEEMMTLPERMRLQMIEDIVKRYPIEAPVE